MSDLIKRFGPRRENWITPKTACGKPAHDLSLHVAPALFDHNGIWE